MAQKFVLAGVGNIQLFDPATGDIIVTSKTLTDSGISFSVTAEDIRGGQANALIAQYFHDSAMSLTLTDSLFSLEYLALNVGGTISYGSDVMGTEQITTTQANKITVTSDPQDFGGLGTIGWYTVAGKDNWTKIVFSGKTANVAELPSGTTVCVQYVKEDASSQEFTVSSAFIPSQCHAILTLPLFKAGTEATTSYTSSSKVGEVQVEIPNFMLSGAQDLSLSASGASTSALSGNALVSYTGNEGCSGEGYYAKLKQITYNKDEFADVKAIAIVDSNVELNATEEQTLQVLAVYGGIVAPKLIDNSKLTFTSSKTNVATVTGGTVKAIAQGESTIEVVVTGKPELNAMAVVTVQ